MSANDRRVLIKPVRPATEGLRFDLVGDDQLTGGVAIWNAVDRPRRRSAVEWAGTSGYVYTLPLLITGSNTVSRVGDQIVRENRTVIEADCRRLMSWASKATKDTGEPAVVRLAGPLRAPESTRWVITDLAWGEQIRNRHGQRVQQYVTVTLAEWSQVDIKRSPAKKSRHKHGKD